MGIDDPGVTAFRLATVVPFVGLFVGFVVFMAGVPVGSVPGLLVGGVVEFVPTHPLVSAGIVTVLLAFLFARGGGDSPGMGPGIGP